MIIAALSDGESNNIPKRGAANLSILRNLADEDRNWSQPRHRNLPTESSLCGRQCTTDMKAEG